MAGLGLSGPLALDSNCLIYLLEKPGSEESAKVEAAIRESAQLGFVVSTLTIAELLTGAIRYGGTDPAAILSAVLQGLPGVTIVPLDLAVAERSARIRADFSLKLPDAVVVASALAAGSDVLLTNDRQVARAPVPGIRIVYLDDITS